MSDSAHPSLQDILDAFERLADRITASPSSRLDPFVSVSLRRACEELRRYIPGLEPPPDAEAARFLARAAYAALEDNDVREALARSLRGLAFAPHHPGLFFVASSACFEFGAVEDAIRLLRHALWIHPGHAAARRDLEALTAFQKERWGSGEQPEFADHAPLDPELAFDFLAEDASEAPPKRASQPPPRQDRDAGQDEDRDLAA